MASDHYISIAAPSQGEFRDRGSKFLAFTFPIKSEDQLTMYLEQIKEIHPKARHYCFAYRLGADKYNFRAYDDGEPSGSAGKPILASIDSHNLSDTLVIVVRYFGGTKLGVSGLINAYRTASDQALCNTRKEDVYIKRNCRIHFDYALMGKIMDAVKSLDVPIIHKEFTIDPSIEIEIRASAFKSTIAAIKAQLLGWNIEDVDDNTSIPNCTFET